ncbi:uncharacterized protein A1O9_08230 [Exophiala aquamarina CBS 119918]|uniref:2-oxoadipate dioxygenase/decarboxylase n=1 Tax=Exophiala aquamarina CBS 119918 TaxID=1182545 RepID=A0A072PIW9_9EURO|nr:uncharacterized protein A1O9_08230 [Exophiala aquamarina CBS 119918]KEF55480.1 hypothetical protein A1O9_08230 [Exophiala aquamarina CBS 119918]
MYRAEVPAYGALVQIVKQVDSDVLTGEGKSSNALPLRHQLERHGAIRLGTDQELRDVTRLFAVMGMYPVGYYDLRVAGIPLHATAFRPVREDSLVRNPFRVFTSVLRKSSVPEETRKLAEAALVKRSLFSERLLELVTVAERGEPMTGRSAEDLIAEALKIFKWHSRSTVALNDYLRLKKEHPMIADIVCFPSAHINHLTPRTLDIELVQKRMVEQGLPAKERIEGPPVRNCPILLRQTSFQALEEQVQFLGIDGAFLQGTHTARFGEVEQRGAALTRRGRALYDQLLQQAILENETDPVRTGKGFDLILKEAFSKFPDSWEELRSEGLVYFRYQVTPKGISMESLLDPTAHKRQARITQLLSRGSIECAPITYEDFLPLSAAGIFKSNLGDEPVRLLTELNENGLRELEGALGRRILDPFELYEELEQDSIRECREMLCLDDILLY